MTSSGIRTRLPYLAWLGVDAVWLSPFYRSPMVDFGYDVSDHQDVDPLFGSLEDWDRLAAAARALGLRLILDFVPDRHLGTPPLVRLGRAARLVPVAGRADQLGECSGVPPGRGTMR